MPSLPRSLMALIVGTVILMAAAGAALRFDPKPEKIKTSTVTAAPSVTFVDDLSVPLRREPPPPPPPPPPPAPKPKAVATAKPKPQPAVRVVNVDVYKGLGAWVDIYDDNIEPIAAVDEMSRRGVKTLYLETNNWRSRGVSPCEYGPDVSIRYPERVIPFLDRAHAKGINVVAWYVPGFADMDRDIKRSLDAINFSTPAGNRFDGFAPDIESRGEFGCKGVSGDEQRVRFNAGIVEYTNRLRAQVGADKVLGAIVVDAKNNERAPSRWEGFPWPEIGKSYDAIMPMAYWSAAKGGGCQSVEVDTATYIKEVAQKTTSLMGITKPMHLIGGIVDCITVTESAGYVASSKSVGGLGVSLYDFATTEAHSGKDSIWAELAKFAQ